MRTKMFIVLIILVFSAPLFSARTTSVTTPDESQKAAVYQRIGLTDIKIVYYSPAVKERKVWEKLVPPEKVWRAGANENTIIKFTTDVIVEGKQLPAGKYGLHMIPGAEEWTIIFSKNNYSWGSYFYKEKDDALRVKVKPQSSEFREWLTYEFTDRKKESATMLLKWEKLAVPVKISVNTKEIVLANLRKELNSLPFWYWRGTYNAAKYCLDNNINLQEALTWIDQSIKVEENFVNTMLKSDILGKLGLEKESASFKRYADKIALPRELTRYAYSFWYTDKKKTESVLIKSDKRFNNWLTKKALGSYYTYLNKKEIAAKYFRLSLKNAPAHQKDGILKTLKTLEK